MNRPSPPVRILWLCAAVLQLSLRGAVSWADTRLDPIGAHATPHVESHATTTCVRIHPYDCALCRFVVVPFGVAHPVAVALDLPEANARPSVSPALHRTLGAWALARPRAPPPLS